MKRPMTAALAVMIAMTFLAGCVTTSGSKSSSSSGVKKAEPGTYSQVPASLRGPVKEAEFDLKQAQADGKLADEKVKLAELQKDASRNQSELAELAGMSRTSCWRRIRDFEEAGLIERQVVLLNPKLAGFTIEVLLLVAMTEHSDENRERFERHVSLLPEVLECFSVSGERDYLLQVVARDMDSYNDFLNAYRVGLAIEKLKSGAFGHLTIEAIGREVGFGSKSAFYDAFKKQTGHSPSQFMKQRG